jgi:RHS repeat-associated protein
MAGISSKAAGKLENRFKYNGIEQNTDLDLNEYDAFYRTLDPQVGRWWQIDPQTDNTLQEFSPYASMRNNPILRNDPLGDLDNYTIKETGEIQREVTADKTDNFKYVKNDGTTTDLGTFEKNDKGLDKVPKEGTNFKNYTKSGKDFVEGFTLAAVLGAAYEFKQETGLDIQINQLNGSDGGHSSHKGDGQFADIRYVNKNGNVDQGSVWTDNSLGLNNYDAAKSQILVDKFQKFGFKDSPGRVSMLTENSKGNAPALGGTYFPGHGKAPNNFHHRHHIHLQHNVNFLKNKKP